MGSTGELKYRDGFPVLVVSGTPEQMGDAVGSLAVRPAPKVLRYPRELLKLHGIDALWSVFVRSGRQMYRHFPADYRTELEALVKAGHVDRDAVVTGNTLFDLKKVVNCSALLIAGDRSATGGPVLARNLDHPSLGYVHEYSLVTVYRPAGKHAFVSVGFPGLVGCLSGMNDAGLAVAILEVYEVKQGERYFDPDGVPYALCYRKILEECSTIAEAKKLLEGLRRTTTTNLAVADRKGVAVLEVAPQRVEQRTPDLGVLVCTNHFCTPALRAARPIDVNDSLTRFEGLGKARQATARLTLDDLRKHLDANNLGELTLQTMAFDTANLRLHLSLGPPPASAVPLKCIDLGPLFRAAR
jgi:predicted choloylglycine hydrolase